MTLTLNGFDFQEQQRKEVNTFAPDLSSFMTRVFGYMGLAVLVSAVTAIMAGVVFKTAYMSFLATHSWFSFLLIILEFALVFGTSFSVNRGLAKSLLLLFSFALVNGLMLSTIFMAYTTANIFSSFIAAAVIFGGMSIYGMITHRDLSRIGTQATFALFGVIVVTIINMFLKSSMVTYIFSYIIIAIFIILTAWDVQRMRQIYENYGSQYDINGLAVQGSLQLYLDFINIFLYVLEIFGFSNNRN